MKKTVLILLLVIPSLLLAQQKKDFVRSSLHMHLVDDFSFDNGDKVLEFLQQVSIPSKL